MFDKAATADWTRLPGMSWDGPTRPPRELADRAIALFWAREAHPWSRRFGWVGEGLVVKFADELLAWLRGGQPYDELDGYLRRVALSMAAAAARGHLSARALAAVAQENYDYARVSAAARR